MALNVLNFNENKAEVTLGAPWILLSSLAQYPKPIVNDLGIKLGADVKFDSQIKTVQK